MEKIIIDKKALDKLTDDISVKVDVPSLTYQQASVLVGAPPSMISNARNRGVIDKKYLDSACKRYGLKYEDYVCNNVKTEQLKIEALSISPELQKLDIISSMKSLVREVTNQQAETKKAVTELKGCILMLNETLGKIYSSTCHIDGHIESHEAGEINRYQTITNELIEITNIISGMRKKM